MQIQLIFITYSSWCDLFDVTGGLAIVIGGVTLVLTAKGLAMAGAFIGGLYTAGYDIG